MAAFDEIWESSLVCYRDQQWWEDSDDEELDEKLSTQRAKGKWEERGHNMQEIGIFGRYGGSQ
ncbi:hypothetical protein E4U52_000610 [Claviceps spartinae]|nr:hypothetical protein E4U52_000610 [Claviceps spartinae]